MAYDSNRQRTVLFGGLDSASDTRNDTWEWDGVIWVPMAPANSPSPRQQTAMAFDAGRGVVVLFGGRDGSLELSDTWEWDGGCLACKH